MVHPERAVDQTATAHPDMLVIDRPSLVKLSEAVRTFGTALATEEVRGDMTRIRALLTDHGFRPKAFTQRYCKAPHARRQRT